MFGFFKKNVKEPENAAESSAVAAASLDDEEKEAPLRRLGQAIRNGETDEVMDIFTSFDDPNFQTESGFTALHLAADEDAAYLMKPFIDGGADPELLTSHGNSALHIATMYNKASNVFSLLECGVDPNLRCSSGRTALHFSIKGQYGNITEALIRSGADVNATDKHQISPLDMAIDYAGQPEIALLLMRGADPNARIGGETCLHRLAAGGLPKDYFDLLIQAGADTSLTNDNGQRAYDVAMRSLREDLAELLR